MSGEILVFWRLPDGTRCVVGHAEGGGWQLRVTRGEEQLLAEHHDNAPDLFARAQQVRDFFRSRAAAIERGRPSSATSNS